MISRAANRKEGDADGKTTPLQRALMAVVLEKYDIYLIKKEDEPFQAGKLCLWISVEKGIVSYSKIAAFPLYAFPTPLHRNLCIKRLEALGFTICK